MVIRSRQLLNLVLVVILAMLLILVIYEPGKETPSPAVLLTPLTPAEIQKITLHTPREQRIVLEKQGAQWFMREPFQARANNARLEKILAVTQAPSHSRYAVAELDLTQLGLAKPDYVLQLDQLELRFGGTDALSQNRYLQLDDTVHLITDRYSYLLQGAATDFIDSQLLTEAEDIHALKLPALELRMVDNQWQVLGQAEQPSMDRINQLLDTWRHARAARITPLQETPQGESISLELSNPVQTIDYIVSHHDNEIILSRPDLALNYHFPESSGEQLFTLPTTIE